MLRLSFQLLLLACTLSLVWPATGQAANTEPAAVYGFTTSEAAQAGVDAAQDRVKQEEKIIAQWDEVIRKLMMESFSDEVHGPDYQDIDDQINELKRQLIDLPARRLAELRDLREGLYCGGCGRTKTDLLSHGEQFPHPGQQALQRAATPDELAKKSAEFDREEANLRERIALLEQQRESRRDAWQQRIQAGRDKLAQAQAARNAAQERRYQARCSTFDALYAVSVLQRRERRAREAEEAAQEKKQRDERGDLARKAKEADAAAHNAQEQQREAEAKAREAQRQADEARRRGDTAAEKDALARGDAAKQEADRASAERERARRDATDYRHDVVQSGLNLPPSDQTGHVTAPPTPSSSTTARVIWEQVGEHFESAKKAFKAGSQDALDYLRSGVDTAKDLAGVNEPQGSLVDRITSRLVEQKDKLVDEATEDAPPLLNDKVGEHVRSGLDDLLENDESDKPKSFFEESRLYLVDKIKDHLSDFAVDKIKERVIRNAQNIVYNGQKLAPETTSSDLNDAGKRFDDSVGAPNLIWETAPGRGAGVVKGVENALNQVMDNFFDWSNGEIEHADAAPGQSP